LSQQQRRTPRGVIRRPGDANASAQTHDGPAAVARTTGEADDAGETTEAGGPKGLEPTRYGDWERQGRCIDF
jgi:hypothetical protein